MTETEVSPRRAKTRRRLVKAAFRIFARQGVGATTVEELCEEADFTRGAFYSNFSSKEELCAAVLQYYSDCVISGIQSAVDTTAATNDSTLIADTVGAYLSTFHNDINDALMLSEMRLLAAREPKMREVYQLAIRDTMAAYVSSVQRAVDLHHLKLTAPTASVIWLAREIYTAALLDQAAGGPDARTVIEEQLVTALQSFIQPCEPEQT